MNLSDNVKEFFKQNENEILKEFEGINNFNDNNFIVIAPYHKENYENGESYLVMA